MKKVEQQRPPKPGPGGRGERQRSGRRPPDTRVGEGADSALATWHEIERTRAEREPVPERPDPQR